MFWRWVMTSESRHERYMHCLAPYEWVGESWKKNAHQVSISTFSVFKVVWHFWWGDKKVICLPKIPLPVCVCMHFGVFSMELGLKIFFYKCNIVFIIFACGFWYIFAVICCSQRCGQKVLWISFNILLMKRFLHTSSEHHLRLLEPYKNITKWCVS